ncbi:MAG: biotin-dependent carboxyltransferase family protein [Hyphomicrobiaceae bacterium]
MNASLRVIQPGLMTTVQDLGRHGFQRFGIPVSGALDPVALRIANIIVGNPQATAGLEMAIMGPALAVEADSVTVALAGDGTGMAVEKANGERHEVPSLQGFTLARGDTVRITGLGRAAVAYLAIAHGLALTPFLGSLSTYPRGAFGGLEGRPLAAGDHLPLMRGEAGDRPPMRLADFDLRPATVVRVVLGPQDGDFTPAAIETFLGAPYTVSRDADRMGLRLEGAPLEHTKGYNIISDGIAPGSIQVPGSRQPIVLLSDRQTTGGYPKIATVISADLPAVGRLTPGMKIRFEKTSVAEAQAARHALEQRIAAVENQLEIARSDGLDLDALYSANLISGVTHAAGDTQ